MCCTARGESDTHSVETAVISGNNGMTSVSATYRAVDFLIMEGQNLSAIAPSFLPFGGALGSARQAWVLIAAVIMLPTGDLGISMTMGRSV